MLTAPFVLSQGGVKPSAIDASSGIVSKGDGEVSITGDDVAVYIKGTGTIKIKNVTLEAAKEICFAQGFTMKALDNHTIEYKGTGSLHICSKPKQVANATSLDDPIIVGPPVRVPKFELLGNGKFQSVQAVGRFSLGLKGSGEYIPIRAGKVINKNLKPWPKNKTLIKIGFTVNPND